MKFVRAAGHGEAQAELLVLPLIEGPGVAERFAGLDRALEGALGRAEKRGFTGRFASTAIFDALGRLKSERVMLLGLGARDVLDRARLNSALELGLRQAGSRPAHRLAVGWSEALAPEVTPAGLAAAATEASIVAAFSEATHKSKGEAKPGAVQTLVLAGFPRLPAGLLERSVVLGEETLFARGLVNQPASELDPASFAAIARRRARSVGLGYEVIGRAELERLRYGAILAVGLGSATPPRLVVLRHRAAARKGGPLLGLVGKGITFDSGGISIKPAADMGYMKGDMGGAAAVLGAMCAIARLKLDVDVVAVLCLAENMVSSTSMRPGDVVRSGSGKTIEVISTDAEGRMVMADGMHHLVKLGVSHVLDIATLTGGQRVALGQVAAHVQGSDPDFTARLVAASESSGDRVWVMPTFPEYRAMIDSPIADLLNSTARDGMAITSGLFMREFSGGRPWIHVDMAAPSWNRVAAIKDMPKGPTGYGVRLLANLVEGFTDHNPDKFSRK